MEAGLMTPDTRISDYPVCANADAGTRGGVSPSSVICRSRLALKESLTSHPQVGAAG